MSDYAAFQTLLLQLQSSDNESRTRSETAYDAITPTTRFTLLLQVLNDKSVISQSRHMAAILARRLLVNDYGSAFEPLPVETKNSAKQQLVLILVHEREQLMRRKVADLISELVRMQFDDDGNSEWPEFTSILLEWSNSPDSGLREIACHIFGSVPSLFGNQQAQSIGIIGQFLVRAISDPSSSELRAAGLRALAAFTVQNATEDSVLQSLRELVPVALQAIATAIQTDSEDDTPLKALVDIADAAHKYLRPYLAPTLELCYKILCNEELEETQRHLALEVIVTLAENIPAGVRKSATLIESLVGTLLNMMSEVDEEPDWADADTAEEEDDSSNALTAELALDRLSCAVGGQHILNEIRRSVPNMLQHADWKRRYAGLMAISACSEGSSKQMETMLGSILDAVLPRLSDPHPRVRYAACNSVGQMATDFGPKLQKTHHSTVLPALVQTLNDTVPRVQANAGAALVNFCEKVPQHILVNYLDDLVSKLEQIMNSKFQEMVEHGRKLVLMQIVTTVASVADAAEKKFLPYYDRFMPVLKYIMENATHKDLRLLRGKTIECISLIGLAVGKEKFIQDVGPVMNLLLQTQTQPDSESSDEDDPQASYMISAWARICKLLGRDFESYLPVVMPQVLRSACVKPEICILDNDEADDVESDVDWQVVKLGEDRNYAIRTSGLEDKATACQMLVCYAREMKESFAPYCQQVLDIMVPLLDFYFNDEVRSAAAECLPFLLSSMKVKQPELVKTAWERVHKSLIRAVTNEPERDVVADHLQSLANSIEAVGKTYVTSDQLAEIRNLLDHLFHEHFEKSDERLAQRQNEDYDEFEEERLLSEKDEDEYVLSKMCDIVHSIFAAFGVEALPFFQQLMVFCVKLLEQNRPWSDLQWGICLWDEIIEFTGTQSWQFHQFFLPTFVQAVHHQQPDVRQAVVYGIGVAAMKGGPEYNQILSDFVGPLIQLVEAPDSKSEENNLCTENAISAITKIMKYRPECLPPALGGIDALIVRWLGWLPICDDTVETEHVYGYLCDLIEANNPVVIGPDNSNLPRIVRAIAESMSTGGLSDTNTEENRSKLETVNQAGGFNQQNGLEKPSAYQRCVSILRHIQSNSSLVEVCVSQLNEEQRKALGIALMGQ
ncbi:putative importin-beta 3 [Schistosoma mansoni]|uniref:putative importin-beta 3 n=1 Tax=Schistosoma mansoni TaxID=6183 RepID=UPI0001A635F1|nr:putative importin-beta 3 [Schistosoma mansoni]|eukprot:XP_018655445.1 putative importin-beta 3 [Schistosoma mansoni]